MRVVRIIAGEFGSNCWLVFDETTREAVIIDPSPDIAEIKKTLDEREVVLKYILLTHGHFDHMTSCDTLRDLTGAPLAIHRDDEACLYNSVLNANRTFMNGDLVFDKAEILLSDGDVLYVGNFEIKVLHTPGHTKGSVCYIIGDCMFTGDTLFDCSVGRCDLAGGCEDELFKSLSKIKKLEGDFKIFTGHGSNTTLEKQKKLNCYLVNL